MAQRHSCFLEHITNSSNSAEGNGTQALGPLHRSFPVSGGAIKKVSQPLIRPLLPMLHLAFVSHFRPVALLFRFSMVVGRKWPPVWEA